MTRLELDLLKWEKLVAKQEVYSYFSSVEFLDLYPVSIDFVILGDYKGGMVLPYKHQMGTQVLVTPFFMPFSMWMGKVITYEKLNAFLQIQFAEVNFLLSFPESIVAPKKRFQVLGHDSTYGSQAQRSLKKASAYTIQVNENIEACIGFVAKELLKKDKKLSSSHSKFLTHLLKDLCQKGRLLCLSIELESEIRAAQFFVLQNNKYYYLKGAAEEEVMKNGGMYLLMDQVIQTVKREGGSFDFGGSNLDGIRQFYLNLGGEDRFYYHISWSNASLFYRILKQIRNKIVGK